MNDSGVYLHVPVLNQWEVFPTASRQNNYACWYTSAFMVLLYRMGASSVVNLANLETLKRLYANRGLGPTEDAALASELGLEHSPSSVLFTKRDAPEYEKALTLLGPLLFSEAKHMIVLTGCFSRVTGEKVLAVNDPWGGNEVVYSISEFNARIAWNFPIHFRRTRFEPMKVLKPGPNLHPYQTRY